MSSRRMLLNSIESFVGTMRIEYYCENGKLCLGLNDNIKIIEEHFADENGYYIVEFKKDLIVYENFINYSGYCDIYFYSDYNIIFDTRSVYGQYLYFYGNFTFNEESIISLEINLYDYNYIFNNYCFDTDYIYFLGRVISQYYKHTNNFAIYANSHILYDLMKYNNIEEGNEEAKNYHTLGIGRLIISSPTEYITTIPNVDLGNNNYIKSVNNYRYNGNYITEYNCNSFITHLRKDITLPKDSTIYILDSVIDINNDTFMNEKNLKKIVIFGNCKLTYLDGFFSSNLENIEIYSDKIEIIKEHCFTNSNLKTITISKSVEHIGDLAFTNLSNLVINYKGMKQDWDNIYLNNWYDNTKDIIVNCTDGSFVVNPYHLCRIYYTSADDNIIDINTEYVDYELLSNIYEDKGELIFKNAINNIWSLFENKIQLTEVWLPNYNITYTVKAFYGCTNLVKVNNSKQLKAIEENTFQNCINLQQIEIDSYLIGDFAFNNCTSLNYVKISKRTERICEDAFINCTSLESIDYEGTIEEWNNINIASDWRDGSAIKTIHCSDGNIQL